jgi:hypothetical protein
VVETPAEAVWLMFGRIASMTLAPGIDLERLALEIPTSGFGGPEDPLRVWPLAPWDGVTDFTGQVAVGVSLGRWPEGLHRNLPLPSYVRGASDPVALCIRNLWGPALIDEGFVRYWQAGPAGTTQMGPWSQPGFLLVAGEGLEAVVLRGASLGPWVVEPPPSGDGYLAVSSAEGEVAWGYEVVRAESGGTTHFVLTRVDCESIDAAVAERLGSVAQRSGAVPEWLLDVKRA